MRARNLIAMAALAGAALLAPRPAPAITAADARTQSFKLQSEGMRLYKEGKIREATEAFRQVVNINLNSFLAHYYLGICLAAGRRYSDAIEPLRIALDLQPDYIQAHLALGDAYLKLGDAAEARAEYLRALELQPNYAAAHDGLGRLFEGTGRDDAAEAEYRKALEINIAYADASTHLGDLYLRRDRLDEAVDLFLKAIAVRPDFSAAYTRLGIAYSRLNLDDDAIAATRKAQDLSPQDPEPHVALARIYLGLESDRRAEAELQTALGLDHDHPAAHLILADLRKQEGDFAAAIEVLEELYERGVEDAQMRRAVAEALKKARAEAARFTALEAATRQDAAGPADLVAFARFLSSQGAHRRAAEILDRAAAAAATPGAPAAGSPAAGAAPGPEAVRFEQAGELLAGRLFAEAIRIYGDLAGPPGAADTAIRSDALFNLGVAKAALGLDDAALATFEAFLADHPDDPRALLYIGNAQYRLGRRAEARDAWSKYLERAGSEAEATRVRKLLGSLEVPSPGGPAR